MEVAIQPAGLRDLNDLRRLEKECFGEDAWSLLDLIGVLTLPGTVRFKAVAQGKMAGFIAGEPKPEDNTGWVTTIGVVSDMRRLGVASALLDACEQALELPRVRLCVRVSNEPAQRLYTRRGYHLAERWARYYIDGEDALVLEKTLRRPPTANPPVTSP